jgi:hypothetical protein
MMLKASERSKEVTKLGNVDLDRNFSTARRPDPCSALYCRLLSRWGRKTIVFHGKEGSQMAGIIIVGGKVDGTLNKELIVSYLGSVATVRSCKNLHG